MIPRLACLFAGHEYQPDRAENYEADGYVRVTDGDRAKLPSCNIVNVCQRCGKEDRFHASVEFAERHGIPTEWDSNDLQDGRVDADEQSRVIGGENR